MIKAYDNLGSLAWGFFVIYLDGMCYSVREPDATYLACSYSEVKKRLNNQGQHTTPLLSKFFANVIVWAHIHSCWQYPDETKIYLGFNEEQLSQYFHINNINWAPDGDEAFDDGSRVLQFDEESYVRIIGYTDYPSKKKTLASIREIKMPSDEFYNILSTWIMNFDKE